LSPEDTFARFNEDAKTYFQSTPLGTFPPAADENASLMQVAEDPNESTFPDLGFNWFHPTLGNQDELPSNLFQFENASQNHVYDYTPGPRQSGLPILPTVTYPSAATNRSPAKVCYFIIFC
jgi:hypothetical protein